MKINYDSRRFGYNHILYELEAEDKELYNTKFKYFISNGKIGLFGNNAKHLIHSIQTIEGR